MNSASKIFYRMAQQANVHQFLEITGFMNELVKMYGKMVAEGKDIFSDPLQPKPYEMAYIAEKIDCIFGPALQDPKTRAAFLETLEHKGGWRWRG